jgi:type IV secretory pathway VirB4 component
MLIPNYDNKKKNNFKQLYNYMPSKSFRMLICGPSGSGKTNALVHMLLKPLIYYDIYEFIFMQKT